MRERMKTLLLLALVLSSIILTALLLFGVPPLETVAPPAYEKLAFGELRPPNRQVLPVLRFGVQQVFPWMPEHDRIWETIRQLLAEAQGTSLERQEKPNPGEDGQLLVQFPLPVPPEVWAGAPQSEMPAIAAIAWLAIDPGAIWYLDERGDWLRAVPANFRLDRETLRETFNGVASFHPADRQEWAALGLELEEEILLPASLPVLAPRFVLREELDFDKLLRSIFPHLTLVRRIEEREGAVIYTDGQKGLRLFDSGEVEFSAPKSEPGLERMTLLTALRRTAQYLQLMGGWPEHLFVSRFTPEGAFVPSARGNKYAVTFFSAQHGKRLLQQAPPLRLRFSDRGIISYSRQIRLLGDKAGKAGILVSPLTAAASLAEALAGQERKPSIKEVFAAYYIREPVGPQSVAQPVWALVCSDGRTAVVHGYSGRLLAWLE
ncbi:MAG: hypothetical protein DDT21_00816 [Syntrophomonadaceae bacterium]|nr:hypothetical protein [Bacillota bacterium]